MDGGYLRNCKSSFHGKVIHDQSFLRTEISSSVGGRIVVASVVYNTLPFFILDSFFFFGCLQLTVDHLVTVEILVNYTNLEMTIEN